MQLYQDVRLFIDGAWLDASSNFRIDIVNPANDETIGQVASAGPADLDNAVVAAQRGFVLWRQTSAFDRYRIMRRAAELLRERLERVATLLTIEQGKPLREARIEVSTSADIIDWLAEESRRQYGRVIPARAANVRQVVHRHPIGPVAAFTPWNFPIAQATRKVAAALAAGCSIIVKGPEDTPAGAAELVRAFADAGLPKGVLNLIYGVPAEISTFLIPHPTIRKISFTGSVPVGKQLAELAGRHMKPATMELGGHAPAMIFDDADIDLASKVLVGSKFRNAGQVCVSPTRFLVQSKVYDSFLDRFATVTNDIVVGNGLDEFNGMGPLVNDRRVQAIEALVEDAVQRGARVVTGGRRLGNTGCFFKPTVLADVDESMRAMNEEPFGPLALVKPFTDIEEAISEANRLPFGLASYAFTRSEAIVHKLSSVVESGMMSVNHLGLALPEVPFGGIKDSGYGSEGGTEAIEPYLHAKFVSHAIL